MFRFIKRRKAKQEMEEAMYTYIDMSIHAVRIYNEGKYSHVNEENFASVEKHYKKYREKRKIYIDLL